MKKGWSGRKRIWDFSFDFNKQQTSPIAGAKSESSLYYKCYWANIKAGYIFNRPDPGDSQRDYAKIEMIETKKLIITFYYREGNPSYHDYTKTYTYIKQ